MRNPVTQDKLVRTFARGLPEQAGEMIRTKADLVGQGREGQIVAHVRVHEVRQAGQLSLRQSMDWRSRMTRSRYRTIVAQQVNGKHLGSGVRIQFALGRAVPIHAKGQIQCAAAADPERQIA